MTISRISSRVFLTATLLLFGGCGNDEGPTFVPDDNCIGSAGGEVVVVDEGNPLHGAKVTVAPDTWDKCWSVYIWRKSTFSTPNFPDGLAGHDGMMTGSLDINISRQISFEETIFPPDSLDLGISFPLNGGTTELGEVITAFRWDEDAELWRLGLPRRLDDTRLEIDTHHHGQLWTWGTVDLGEADYELYVEPAMREMMGSEAYDHVLIELQELHDSIVEEELAIRCDNLLFVRDLFDGTADHAASRLREFQDGLGGSCGVCDVTTTEFYEELLEYFKLNAQAYIAQLFFIENSPHWLMTIFGHFIVGGYMAAIEALPCDFGCFFGAGTWDFYSYLAIYYVSIACAEVINFAMSTAWLGCL